LNDKANSALSERPASRLTETFLKVLQPPERGARFVYDSEVTGFAVKVYAPTKAHPEGARTFLLSYWVNGRERRYRIGSWPDWSATAARAEAKEVRQRVDCGEDPARDRRDAKELCRWINPGEDPASEWRDAITAKFLSFIERDIEPACYLYRHFDPNGELLYVGISLHALNRQDQHFKEAGWRRSIYQIVIEPFETREQALAAEEFAIRNEFPKFNGIHNRRRHPYQELGQLDEAAAAKEIGVSVRTLRAWRRRGVGPPYAFFGRTPKYNKRAMSEHYEAAQIMPVRSRKQRVSGRNDLERRT
jgi:Arm DNA-binding domain